MKTSLFAALLLLTVVVTSPPTTFAGQSETKKEEPSRPELTAYNEGCALIKSLKFAEAAAKFQQAISINENFPEAHNNLAYSLRKQGQAKYVNALEHYNRALVLNPKLPEAYMYRGVLHIQMGNPQLAAADLDTLKGLSQKLATQLEWVITNGKEKSPEGFFGVTNSIK